jgi:hypothetical protein
MNAQRRMPFLLQCRCIRLAPRGVAAVFHPCRKSQPARRNRSRQRSVKAEGKIKGGGTLVCRKAGLHVGGRGTRLLWRCAACNAKAAPALIEWRASPAGLCDAALEWER